MGARAMRLEFLVLFLHLQVLSTPGRRCASGRFSFLGWTGVSRRAHHRTLFALSHTGEFTLTAGMATPVLVLAVTRAEHDSFWCMMASHVARPQPPLRGCTPKGVAGSEQLETDCREQDMQ